MNVFMRSIVEYCGYELNKNLFLIVNGQSVES